jgi:SAM-dependent methyltransferase
MLRAMRVGDLDRDMSEVVPVGADVASRYLFDRMTALALEALHARPGMRVLDVAAGFGQDSAVLRERGVRAIAVEPSRRMTGAARWRVAQDGSELPTWVRGWSTALPFATASFDAVLCKGSLDHFSEPLVSLREMARVTRAEGRVVLAVANFRSCACRAAALWDRIRARLGGPERCARRSYDVPSDHFTRYDVPLVRAQASRWMVVETCVGVSLGWGMPGWSRAIERLPGTATSVLLRGLDRIARRFPEGADVVVVAGRPRASSRVA